MQAASSQMIHPFDRHRSACFHTPAPLAGGTYVKIRRAADYSRFFSQSRNFPLRRGPAAAKLLADQTLGSTMPKASWDTHSTVWQRLAAGPTNPSGPLTRLRGGVSFFSRR